MVNHTKLEQEVPDVVALGERDVIASSDDLDSQKVMKFVHVFHFELPENEHLDLVDVG